MNVLNIANVANFEHSSVSVKKKATKKKNKQDEEG